jgi:DNA polymerase phi
MASEPGVAAAVSERLAAVAARKAFLREAAAAVLLQLAGSLDDEGLAELVRGSAGGPRAAIIPEGLLQPAWLAAGTARLPCTPPAASLLAACSLPAPASSQRSSPQHILAQSPLPPLTNTGLQAWLALPPEDGHPEALLLALALWPRLPADVAAACPLLPPGCKAPPRGCYDGSLPLEKLQVPTHLHTPPASCPRPPPLPLLCCAPNAPGMVPLCTGAALALPA